jgi:cyanate permease
MAPGPGLFGLVHDLSGSYAASLCLCIGLQLASSLIILRAPRVREPVGVIELAKRSRRARQVAR